MQMLVYFFKSRCLSPKFIEKLLVFTIIGVVLAFSIKYYNTAKISLAIKDVTDKIMSITAVMDQLATVESGYSGINNSELLSLLGNKVLYTPWNGGGGYDINLTVYPSNVNRYSIRLGAVPSYLCAALMDILRNNPKITIDAANACSATVIKDLTYDYDNAPS